jgi:hypothetical protein
MYVDGILFVHHRYEPERYLVAVNFPVVRNAFRLEKIAIPFSEPFQCAVDKDGHYFFVTDSGRAFSAPWPGDVKPRQVKPLFDETKSLARVLLRDAKTGASVIFVQSRSAESSERDFMIELAGPGKRRELPAGFFASLEGKPPSTVMWKCSEAWQPKP